MKQKDIAVVVAIAGFSAIVAFVVANFVFASPKNRQTQVQVVEPISADFPPVDKRYFNDSSINATQTVEIGETNNPKPFNN